MWDTGASISLVRQSVAEELIKEGAGVETLRIPLKIHGVGSGTMDATEEIIATCKFSDPCMRVLRAVIVPELPFDIIVGYDFMRDQGIGFVPLAAESGFELFDTKKRNRPAIYRNVTSSNSGTGTSDPNSGEASSQINFARPSKPKFSKKLGKKGTRKYIEKWKELDSEDRELILALATIQLIPLPEAELKERLNKVGLELPSTAEQENEDSMFTGSATAEKLHIEQCDFPEVQLQLEELILKYVSVFSAAASDVGKSTGNRVTIKLTESDKVVNIPNYRTPLKLRSILKKLIQDLLEAGIIEKCESNKFNSPCLLVPKKAEGSFDSSDPLWRLVIDYRALNKIIENVVYPIPRIQDIFAEYKGCKVFSNVDIRHAFYTIQLELKSRHLTAFSCEMGKFQFKFLPQGLKISPAVFQEQISRDLNGLVRVNPYMDDILAGDPSTDIHLGSLEGLFQRLSEHGYKLKLSKCKFFKKCVGFLGTDVTEDGLQISPSKIEAARNLKIPRIISQVKSLLGFTSFLRDHVPYYCDAVGPIQELLSLKEQNVINPITHKKETLKNFDVTPYWLQPQQTAFEWIVKLLTSGEILAFPDSEKVYTLWTDASKRAMSAVLMQDDDTEKPRPIGYWSKAFRGSQKNWAPLVKEARAVLEAVQHYAVFITGCKIILKCDHKPLLNFLHGRTKNEMVNRWSLLIQEQDIEIQWVSSEENISDCLSRLCEVGLFKKLDVEQGEDFPPFPQARGETDEKSTTTTSEVSMIGALTGTVPDAPVDRAPVNMVPAPDGTEADGLSDEQKLMGIMRELTVKRIARLTDDQVKYYQKQDKYCNFIKARRRNFNEENGTFSIHDGLLYKHFTPTHSGSERLAGLALVIPKCMQLSVIWNLHKELQHAGRDKMLAALRTRVYWRHMTRQVAEFVKGCRVCQFRHLTSNKYRQLRVTPPKGPGIRMAIDCWSIEGGAQLFLTAIDLHSQYPYAEQIQSHHAENIIEALSKIFSYFRPPLEILSDNGSEFKNDKVERYLKDMGIKHHRFSAPNKPNTNGILERWHSYLGEVYRMNMNLTQDCTPSKAVVAALTAYRRLPHSSSGESPLFLHACQEPTYSIDHLLPTKSREVWQTGQLNLSELKIAHGLARKNLCLARKRASKVERGKQGEPALKVGDRVYRKNMTRNKRDLKWLPGYRITGFESTRTALIRRTADDDEESRPFRVNVEQLRKTDCVSELIQNSNLDVFPGCSKLYFFADDFKDLGWEFEEEMPELDPEIEQRNNEIVRDRRNDFHEQEPPPKRARLDDSNDDDAPDAPDAPAEPVPQQSNRPTRQQKRNVRLKEYLVGFSCVYTSTLRSQPLVKCEPKLTLDVVSDYERSHHRVHSATCSGEECGKSRPTDSIVASTSQIDIPSRRGVPSCSNGQ